MPMKGREVIRLLESQGWREMRSKGSHRHFKHSHQTRTLEALPCLTEERGSTRLADSRPPAGARPLDDRSVESYPITISSILYFQRKMTGSALICSK